MRFGLDSTEKLVNHWLLNSKEPKIQEFAKTVEQKKDSADVRLNIFEAKITVNGVELDFEDFDSWLMKYCEGVVEEKTAQFKNIDAEVQRRVEKRLNEEAKGVIDKLHDFMQKMDDLSSIIKPYWEK